MYNFFDLDGVTALAAIPEERSVRNAEKVPVIPLWRYFDYKGLGTIKRTFEFRRSGDAMNFAVRASKLAESKGLTPVLLVEWRKVTVGWHIHSSNISVKDLNIAQQIEKLHCLLEKSEISVN